MLESLFNIAAGLKSCSSIKKRLQLSRFPVKFEAFPVTPFFTEEFQWLLLRFISYFQRNLERMSVQLSAINTRFS